MNITQSHAEITVCSLDVIMVLLKRKENKYERTRRRTRINIRKKYNLPRGLIKGSPREKVKIFRSILGSINHLTENIPTKANVTDKLRSLRKKVSHEHMKLFVEKLSLREVHIVTYEVLKQQQHKLIFMIRKKIVESNAILVIKCLELSRGRKQSQTNSFTCWLAVSTVFLKTSLSCAWVFLCVVHFRVGLFSRSSSCLSISRYHNSCGVKLSTGWFHPRTYIFRISFAQNCSNAQLVLCTFSSNVLFSLTTSF